MLGIFNKIKDKEKSEVIKKSISTEIKEANETTPPIKVVATIQDTEAQEKELDELLKQLKQVNRHWKVEWARGKKVPMKALLHAASLWLSDDPLDWSSANDTIFQFTSPFGCKKLCYPYAPQGNVRYHQRDKTRIK